MTVRALVLGLMALGLAACADSVSEGGEIAQASTADGRRLALRALDEALDALLAGYLGGAHQTWMELPARKSDALAPVPADAIWRRVSDALARTVVSAAYSDVAKVRIDAALTSAERQWADLRLVNGLRALGVGCFQPLALPDALPAAGDPYYNTVARLWAKGVTEALPPRDAAEIGAVQTAFAEVFRSGVDATETARDAALRALRSLQDRLLRTLPQHRDALERLGEAGNALVGQAFATLRARRDQLQGAVDAETDAVRMLGAFGHLEKQTVSVRAREYVAAARAGGAIVAWSPELPTVARLCLMAAVYEALGEVVAVDGPPWYARR